MVLGFGTLGALPAVQVHSQIADAAQVSATLPEVAPLPPADSPSLLGNVVTAVAPVVPVAPLPSPVLPQAGSPVVVGAPALTPTGPTQQRAARFTTALPDQRAQIAITTAMKQIGLPYEWGGNGPTSGDAGFDCSGLTTFAYAAAQVALPRTAHTQYYAGPHVPQGAPLQPGDLIFYGTPAFVHHVGMYLGEGKMVNAPTFGQPVQVAYYRWTGDDFLGATRPAATGPTTTGQLPYAPETRPTTAPTPFPAPTAAAPTTTPNATVPQPAVSAASSVSSSAVATTTTVTTTATPTTTSSAPKTTTSAPVVVTTTVTKPPSSTTKPPSSATKPPRTSTSTPTSTSTTTSSPPPVTTTTTTTAKAPANAADTAGGATAG